MDSLQRVELNCGRMEARAIDAFDVCSEQVCFPYAGKAAMLMQRTDPGKDPKGDGIVFLLSSNKDMTAENLLQRKRKYWDIENGAHQRLDGSRLKEDKSRVRNRNAATNLGLFRRAVLSLGRKWITEQRNSRKATLNGFLGVMAKHNSEIAFRMTLSKKSSWLP
jgi:predicted transposase YbfD/YdcC